MLLKNAQKKLTGTSSDDKCVIQDEGNSKIPLNTHEGKYEKLLKIFVLILALVVVSFGWNWFYSKKKLEEFSLRVRPGMQLIEVRSHARQLWLQYVISSRRDESGRFRDLVTESGIMGGMYLKFNRAVRL